MTNLISLILALAPQPAPASVPVLGYCDSAAPVIAQAPRDAAMEVKFAIAGTPTCYLVTMTIGGRPVRGYVVDRNLDAVVAFEQSRVATEQATFRAPLYVPPPDPPAAAPPPAPAAKVTATAAATTKKKPTARPGVSM